MASPHVAGIVALMAQKIPQLAANAEPISKHRPLPLRPDAVPCLAQRRF